MTATLGQPNGKEETKEGGTHFVSAVLAELATGKHTKADQVFPMSMFGVRWFPKANGFVATMPADLANHFLKEHGFIGVGLGETGESNSNPNNSNRKSGRPESTKRGTYAGDDIIYHTDSAERSTK